MSTADRHKLFVAEFLRDANAARAAQASGYSPRSASKLLATPAIRAEIDKRQASVAAESRVCLKSLLNEAERAREVAERADNPAAMVGAITLKAKLTGYLVDRVEDIAAREAAERAAAQARENKTAAQMFSEAAQSMGLPANSTPAQVIGAGSERAIATPEFFALMRATKMVAP